MAESSDTGIMAGAAVGAILNWYQGENYIKLNPERSWVSL